MKHPANAPIMVGAHTTWLYRLSPLLVAGLVALALIAAVVIGAQSAVVIVAIGCAIAGTLRWILPQGSVPYSRSCIFDVALLYGFALLLLMLEPYAGPGMDQPVQLL
ncbi:MAG: hypothetical protein Q4Q03_01740 [Bowdeniella nasicola]|nr:hypothetical protein [Bowdeniella nasicola]